MRSTLFILWLLSAIPIYAQSDSLHIYSMQEIYQQNNWLTGANPVGMSFNRFRSFSVAEVGYRFEDGNFGNVSLPASSNKYAVFGESYQTIGNVSLYGKIGYVNNRKQEVNWNGMTGDCWRGINLCDSSEWRSTFGTISTVRCIFITRFFALADWFEVRLFS